MLQKTIDTLLEAMEKKPHKNMLNIWDDLENNRRPSFPSLRLLRQPDPSELKQQSENVSDNSLEAQLATQIENILKPLELENPFIPAVRVDDPLPFAFGLKYDIRFPNRPKEHIPLREFDNFELPDINKSSLFLKIKEQIDFHKAHTPSDIKIHPTITWGSFNLAETILGSEIFYAFTDAPEQLHHLMQLVTDLIIQGRKVLRQWIGQEKILNFVGWSKRITECSCNLISKEIYREFVLPYDLQLQASLGEVGIHPCSGKHVFEETLEWIPNVRYTECGIIYSNPNQVCIDLDTALRKIRGRPIILRAGGELIEGKEEETIKERFSRMRDHDLLSFIACGMYWKKKDDPKIIALHRRLDEYYMNEIYPKGGNRNGC